MGFFWTLSFAVIFIREDQGIKECLSPIVLDKHVCSYISFAYYSRRFWQLDPNRWCLQVEVCRLRNNARS